MEVKTSRDELTHKMGWRWSARWHERPVGFDDRVERIDDFGNASILYEQLEAVAHVYLSAAIRTRERDKKKRNLVFS